MFLSSWSWFFMVLLVFPMFLKFWLRKHWENNKKKHDFQTMVQENQEFMVFIGFCNVSEFFVKKTLEKPIKTMNS